MSKKKLKNKEKKPENRTAPFRVFKGTTSQRMASLSAYVADVLELEYEIDSDTCVIFYGYFLLPDGSYEIINTQVNFFDETYLGAEYHFARPIHVDAISRIARYYLINHDNTKLN